MVFDLIVEAAPQPVNEGGRLHVAGGEDLDGDKVVDCIVSGNFLERMMIEEDNKRNTGTTNEVGDDEEKKTTEESGHTEDHDR